MDIKNVLLAIAVFAFILMAAVFFFDMANVERQRQLNQQINQSQLEPGQPLPPRPESQVLSVPLSGVLFMVGFIILVFYFAFSFYDQNLQREMSVISTIADQSDQQRYESVPVDKTIMNLLSPNERRIVKRLVENHGVCLQSDISRMNDMGKVKAHRYVHNLVKMGIVTIERYGNTNKVFLSDNLKKLFDR